MLSPQSLAAALGLPPPTDEQAAVIDAPARSALVVAGAGAGKTETMAARVVWLVATGQVLPEQVLGLTFTRKAAAAARGPGAHPTAAPRRVPAPRRPRSHRGAARGGAGRGADRRHVPRLRRPSGRASTPCGSAAEPGARLLGSTGAWQLAHRVVATWADDLDVDRRARDRHRVRPRAGRRVRRAPRRACRGAEARRGAGRAARPGAPRAAAEGRAVAALPAVVGRAAHAARPAPAGRGVRRPQAGGARARLRRPARDRRPGGRRAPRGRHAGAGDVPGRPARRVPGHRARPDGCCCARCSAPPPEPRPADPAVTAVGDPCQSIYGWRGASAGNLAAVPRRLPGSGRRSRRRVRPLTSFRNPAEVLALANAVSAPLRAAPGAVGVRRVGGRAGRRSRRRPGRAAAGRRGGARWLADAIAACWQAAADVGAASPTSAVLVRRRRHDAVADALRARGLPVEVVGLGGLLDTPEVVETWSAPCAWSRIHAPGRRRSGCSPGRAGGSARATSRRSGAGAGLARAPPPRRRRRRRRARARCAPGEPPSGRPRRRARRPRGRPAATRRGASPGSARLAAELRRLRAGRRRRCPSSSPTSSALLAARHRGRRPPRPRRPRAPRPVPRRGRGLRRRGRGRDAARVPRLPRRRRGRGERARGRRGRRRRRARADAHRARREGPRVGPRRGAGPRRPGVPGRRSAAAG